MDGARLAYALGCEENDVSLPDLARLCDIFYIGGTKCGALFGEAVVIPDPTLIPHFFTIIKQHGALFAKGRLLGIQFSAMFSDGLYLQIGKPAVLAANRIREIMKNAGYQVAFDSPTNQIFIIVENSDLDRLAELVEYSFWEKYDDSHTVIRLASSWATSQADIDELAEAISGI